LKDKTSKLGLSEKIKIKIEDFYHLSFPSNFFDICLCAWYLQSLKIVPALKEMLRVAKNNGILICILVSEEGDEAKIKRIYNPQMVQEITKSLELVKKTLEKNNCEVVEKRKILTFHFPPSVQETYEILKVISLGENVTENAEEKIKDYLKKKVNGKILSFTQVASFICWYKK
jgi:SAM-dependent methyltransferase